MDRKRRLSSEDSSLDGYSDSSQEQSDELNETITLSPKELRKLLQSASNPKMLNDDKPCLQSPGLQQWLQTQNIKTEESSRSNPHVRVKVEDYALGNKHEPNSKLGGPKPAIKQKDDPISATYPDDHSSSSSDSDSSSASSTDEDNFGDDKSTSKRKRNSEKKKKRKNKKKKKKKKKKKSTRPANARRFVARLYKKEDAREERKRRREEEVADPQKCQKISRKSHPGKRLASQSDTDANGKQQYEQIRMSIPQGCDTRHGQTQHAELREAKKLFGYKNVREKNGEYQLSGMNTSLMPHQLVASAWMVKRELARTAPYGGLLADGMGFRKTIVSLNTIVGNPPLQTDIKQFSGTTLIVVPNQDVARQWESEIHKHIAKPGFTIIHSNCNGWKSKQYKQCWVLIVTYADLLRQHIKKRGARELKEKHCYDTISFERAKWRMCGSLFHYNWYRVILDEAHYIKCHTSSGVASACWDLSSKFRWALSGSPLANSTKEFYSYLRFLRCNFVGSFAVFRNTYCSEEARPGNFDALISLIMLRRTPKDEFLGSRILSLPDNECQDIWIPLSKEEEAIYKVVDSHFRQLVDDEIERRKAEKIKSYIDEEEKKPNIGEEQEKKVSIHSIHQAQYMRLRQAVSHPFNLENCFRRELGWERIRGLQSTLQGLGQVPLIEQFKNSQRYATELSKYSQGLQLLESMPNCAFGGMFNIQALLTLAKHDDLANKATCGICNKRSPPLRPTQSANCVHLYCESCLLRKTAKIKPDSTALKCLVPECSQSLEAGTYRQTLTCIDDEAKLFGDMEYGLDSNGVHLSRKKGEQVAFLASILEETGVKMPPGSKLTAAMAVILTWLHEAPEDKIIVFTEFVTTTKVLGRMLKLAEIPFLFYSGQMGPQQRMKALESFKNNPKNMILLASLRAAGQSLNLTAANRVIIVDPWFNKSQEQQAFCRVHRMGQKKKSYLVRLLTEGGIDERMAALQDAKSGIVDPALQDDGHLPKMPTLTDLAFLFSPREETKLKTCRNPRRH